jgi:hypothetical protein
MINLSKLNSEPNCDVNHRYNTTNKKCEYFACSSNIDCNTYGMLCVDNICECEPNKKKDYILNICYYHCSDNSECQKYDEHRICDQEKCVCDYGYVEYFYDKKCYNNIKFNWLWSLLLIPALIILFICIMAYRIYIIRSKQCYQDIDSLPTRTEISLSIISQNVRIPDPPPAYSTYFLNNHHPNLSINSSPEFNQYNQFSSNNSQSVEDPPPPYPIK